jgi:DNA polymerase
MAAREHLVISDPASAAGFVPKSSSLRTLADAVQQCRGCALWEHATQAVFGEGAPTAAMVLVGEQPGDHEDRQGHPFVGPAGRILRTCVEEAGLAVADVYLTNAVKHFKHEQRGKRRIHKKPNTAEIEACHPWIEAELRAVRATVVVALGATAARSLFGRTIAIAANRGVRLDLGGVPALVTYHPSAVLRAKEDAGNMQRAIVEDLRLARAWVES